MLRRFWLSTALLTATVMQVLDITETREGASIHQRDQDRRPRGHCDQCGDGGDIRVCIHISTYPETDPARDRLSYIVVRRAEGLRHEGRV